MTTRISNKRTNDRLGETARRQPVSFVITFSVKPEHREEFDALLGSVLDAMRHEPTFINAILHRDAQDEAKVMLYETWADFDDVVNEQIRRDYRKAYWDRLPNLLMETQRIETWWPTRGDFAGLSQVRTPGEQDFRHTGTG